MKKHLPIIFVVLIFCISGRIYGQPTATVCTGATTTLTSATTGGVWSSSNTSVATVGSSSGIVSGVSAGTATILT